MAQERTTGGTASKLVNLTIVALTRGREKRAHTPLL
jgi:hypothetical protein